MALASFIPPAVEAAPYRYEELADFTGGLNLRADQANLVENESPDVLNIDVDPRGGVQRRDSVDALNSTALNGAITNVWGHHETGGTNQIMCSALNSGGTNTELWFGTGTDFTQVDVSASAVELTGIGKPAAVTFNDATYITNGSLFDTDKSAVKWTGANDATALTPDIDGSDGHFPQARHAATWGERVWVGYTTESATNHTSRVRFSKINDAENWTSTDFIDIDIGEHGDNITALLADGDRLLVFKENSVYAIYGFDADSFQVQNITRTAGCLNGSQPVATPYGAFFWYAQDGVYVVTQSGVSWVFERLKPAIDQSALTTGTVPSLMWHNSRLWVSADFQSGDANGGAAQTDRRNVFVWDGSLGPLGAWTRYDINARSLHAYKPPGGTHLGLCATSDWSGTAAFTRVSKVDQSADTDDYTGSGASEIYSHYQTRWLAGNRPTFSKRWGKTRTVLLTDNTVTINMVIYKDYNLGSGSTSFSQAITGEASTSVWDTATWQNEAGTSGNMVWRAQGLASIYKFFRWPTAGTARAISIRFSVDPSTANGRGKWGMTSTIGMYRTRRLR